MGKIREMSVNQSRIFQIDEIPYFQLETHTALEEIISKFKFRGDSSGKNNNLRFTKGEFKVDDDIKPIVELEIEQTKIRFTIIGDSNDGNLFYKELETLINKYKDNHSIEPVICVQQTACSISLDLEYKNFFSNKLNRFLETNLIKETSFDYAKSYLKGFRLNFEIGYEIQESIVKEKGVSIVPKYFAVEPRESTKMEEHVYFTTSPTDSETHLKLVNEFEKALKSKK